MRIRSSIKRLSGSSNPINLFVLVGACVKMRRSNRYAEYGMVQWLCMTFLCMHRKWLNVYDEASISKETAIGKNRN